MRFAIWPVTQDRTWEEIAARARQAERFGWPSIWIADHYMRATEDNSPDDTPTLECWSLLAALATTSPTLRIGSFVSPASVTTARAILRRHRCAQ